MLKFLINWIIDLSRLQKQFVMVLVDMFLLGTAIFFSYSLTQAAWFWPDGEIEKLIYISPFLSIPIFYFLGMYQSIVRHMGIKAFMHIFYSVSLYMLLLALIGYYIKVEIGSSVQIFHENGAIYKVNDHFGSFLVFCIINWLISILLIGSSRLAAREIYWNIQVGVLGTSNSRKNILVYGAGHAGIQLATALKFSYELKVCAFIDDDHNIQGKYIYGLKVYKPSSLRELINSYKINEVLIAIPSLNQTQESLIIKNLSKFPVKVSTIPGIEEIAEGNFKIEDRKSINIEDVLGREKIPPINKLLTQNISKKNILITGGGGSIGAELSRQISNLNPKCIILFEKNEYALYEIEKELKDYFIDLPIISILGDICDKTKLLFILKFYKVDTVFHAAAYKHVPMIEKNISEGFKNNVLGTISSVEACIEMKIKNFVLISTDKAVRPTNVMGATKRVSEMIIQAYAEENNKINHKNFTKFSIVRFGNVLGSSGSVLPLFENQIKKGGPITLTHKNITRYFMTTQEAAQLVIQASAIESDNSKGNLFVLDMGQPIKIIELAKKMVELSGLKWKMSKDEDGDIEIKIIGLRPGEKLYEELIIGNQSQETQHPKIIQIKEHFKPLNILKRTISEINKNINEKDEKKIKNLLKKLVEDFNPIK